MRQPKTAQPKTKFGKWCKLCKTKTSNWTLVPVRTGNGVPVRFDYVCKGGCNATDKETSSQERLA
jgi:hypothetical protein